jgi:hypothetical protein
MQSAPAYVADGAGPTRGNPLHRAEAWLDARGKGAWIAAMVLGFIAFWPIGLAIVLYMSFAGKWQLGSGRCSRRNRTYTTGLRAMRSSGNASFDAYKADTLRRLEDEQQAFEEFLQRLREARDKAEFDQFMDERSKRRAEGTDTEES